MLKLEALLPQAKKFLSKTRLVSISKEAIPRLAQDLRLRPSLPAMSDFKNQPLLFYLLVDGLNFCFWHTNPKKKFGFRDHSGSVALGYLILRAMKKYPEFFRPQFLKNFAPAVYAAIMEDSRGKLQLPMERIKIIQEIGGFLKKLNQQHPYKLENVRMFDDVNRFANFLMRHLPYTFDDVSIGRGVKLPFYKKLRLLISDLNALARIKFKNMEKLLIYADYKIPQVLVAYKVLELPEGILAVIKKRQPIPHNSDAEIALRAASVVAASELKKITKLSYLEIDFRLWLLSKKLPKSALPHHRTVSRFY